MRPTTRANVLALALVLGLPLLTMTAAQTTEPEVAAASNTPAARQQLKLSKLQGRARESRTRDVVGATVMVQRNDDPATFYLTNSGGDGAFAVNGLLDGEYTVRLNREGYAPEVKTGIALKYPFRAVVEVTMESGQADLSAPGTPVDGGAPIAIAGRVAGPDGAGLGEISVRIVRQDGTVDPMTLRTPQDGVFLFDQLPRGEWRLEIVGIGYLPLRQRLMIDRDSAVAVQLVQQPQDYIPSPLELMPPEAPIAPEGFNR